MTDDTQDIVARLRRHRYNTWKDDLGPDPEKAEAANLIEEQAKEIERLGRELNRAKYGDPDFSWEAHQAALDMAMAEIEHLHWLLALNETVRASGEKL